MNPGDNWIFGLVGAGGFGREIMSAVESSLAISTGVDVQQRIYFVESNPRSSIVNGIRCISEENFFQVPAERRLFNVAISNSATRRAIAEGWIERGAEPVAIRAQTARVLSNNDVQEGAILCEFSTVTSNSRIGKFFQCNIYSYVAHDCVIGDYVTFAPNVHCNGNVVIGDHAYVGTGAIIRQGTREKPIVIGAGATVGMGAVVTRDVPPDATVIGNPARPLR